MAERPPAGYKGNDKPLHHDGFYKYDLSLIVNKNSTMETYIRSTNQSVDPAGIQVNNRNAGFDTEDGVTCCFDSRIQFINIRTDVSLTSAAIETAKIHSLKFYWQEIFGCWEDSWTATDEVSGATTKTTLDLLSNVAEEDVIPDFQTKLNNIAVVGGQMISNKVDPTEVATGDWGMTTDGSMEHVPFELQEYFDMLNFGTISGKLKSITSNVKSHILTKNNPHFTIKSSRNVPGPCRFIVPHTFYARRYVIPLDGTKYQTLSTGFTPTDIGHVSITTKVNFNEWNPEFDQTRM